MAEPVRLTKEYARYISSGCWICGESPTGAHHWREYPDEAGVFICKYCYEAKEFPIIFQSGKYLRLSGNGEE